MSPPPPSGRDLWQAITAFGSFLVLSIYLVTLSLRKEPLPETSATIHDLHLDAPQLSSTDLAAAINSELSRQVSSLCCDCDVTVL